MRSLLLVLSLLVPSLLLAQEPPPQMPNLVKNPGLELRGADGLPGDWTGDTSVYSQVAAPVHRGVGALQFVNPDKSKYALCRQTLPLQPGKAYEASVWVKCQ